MAENEANSVAEEKSPYAGKGKAFYERAEQVAETGNWDFAIEMYVEGLKREPDNIERGYQPLREVSLKRKAQGGKGPGMRDKMQHRPGKDPIESLCNAAYLLAKEPGDLQYMQQLLAAAQKAEMPAVAKWICDILLESQKNLSQTNKKPNFNVLKLLIESYHDLEEYYLALQACDMARMVSPDNPSLHDARNELSAKYTLKKGKYGQKGEFTKGVKDMKGQQELMQKDSLVQDKRFLEEKVEQARKEYLETPTVAGKIYGLVDALCKIENEAYENEAIDVLKKAFAETKAYQHKLRIGDIKMKQLTRRYRDLLAKGEKEAAIKAAKEQLDFELQEFTDRVQNYPTDLGLKYELGRRQFISGLWDDAIASLQQAQRDPRRHVAALMLLGQAFVRKEWFREAAETFERALESQVTEDRAMELRYLLADVLEQMDDLDRAQDFFSQVAQMDFTYKDVRNRLEGVRKKLAEREG